MATYDLSHPLDEDVTVYPGDPAVELAPAATHEADGYRVTEVRLGSHAGTHLDAPSHTEPDGRNVDDFEVGAFEFDARLADCSDATARDSIGPEALPDDLGADADVVVVRTGWDDHWGTDRYYDHPYLSAAAAAKCAQSGCHVGIDALSVDPTPSAESGEISAKSDEPDGVPAHHQLLGSGRLVVENLTGLADCPERFELRAYPLALAGADGAPVRAVAVV